MENVSFHTVQNSQSDESKGTSFCLTKKFENVKIIKTYPQYIMERWVWVCIVVVMYFEEIHSRRWGAHSTYP